MLRRNLATLWAVGCLALLFARGAAAQQMAISTPFNSLNDSFFERIGIGFGFQLQGANPAGGSGVVGLLPGGIQTPNIVFSQGGFNSALPPFGGHDPNTDAQTGFALLNRGNGLFFNLAAGQGSTRNNINQTPTVVIHNGQTGTVSDTSQTPFVTAIIPVVGDAFIPPYYPTRMPTVHPLHERVARLREQQQQQGSAQRAAAAANALGNENLSREDKLSLKAEASRGSSAGHGDLSVAEIKRQQAATEAAKQTEVEAYIERAKGAEEAGKASVAKIYYRQALARATGELRDELQAKLQELGR